MAMNTLLLALLFPSASGHGRLYEPPGRSTMWRRGFNVPANFDDHEIFCGGVVHQTENGGRCGVCGDPWDGTRENEAGGMYATGVIARTYTIGQTIEVTVQITANHKGFFEFKLCPNNNPARAITQECLDSHLLSLADGDTRYHVTTDMIGNYVMKVKLPRDVICDQCVLQWRYHTGNSWGCEADGHCCVGCGPQEEFYGCSDIAIKGRNSNSAVSSWSGRGTPYKKMSTAPSKKMSTAPNKKMSTAPNKKTSSIWGKVNRKPVTQAPQPHTTGECRATDQYAQVPLADKWCEANCSQGYCPETHCGAACRALMP